MKAWFASRLKKRKGPDDVLGTGLWRQAHDRFTRAVDRYYAVSVGVSRESPDSAVAGELAGHTAALNALADAVQARAAAAQADFPSDSLTVSAAARAGTGDLPRLLSQAATHVATAAEAATMARVALRGHDEAGAREAASSAGASVARAREALERSG